MVGHAYHAIMHTSIYIYICIYTLHSLRSINVTYKSEKKQKKEEDKMNFKKVKNRKEKENMIERDGSITL